MSNGGVDNVALAKRSCSHLKKSISERELSDYHPFFDSLAEGVVFEYVSPNDSREFRGKQAVVEYVKGLFTTLTSPELEEDVQLEKSLEYLAKGDRVVVLWVECTKNRKTGVISNSKEVAVIMDFRDGLITRLLRFSQ